jgi:hypothetical protein
LSLLNPVSTETGIKTSLFCIIPYLVSTNNNKKKTHKQTSIQPKKVNQILILIQNQNQKLKAKPKQKPKPNTKQKQKPKQ